MAQIDIYFPMQSTVIYRRNQEQRFRATDAWKTSPLLVYWTNNCDNSHCLHALLVPQISHQFSVLSTISYGVSHLLRHIESFLGLCYQFR